MSARWPLSMVLVPLLVTLSACAPSANPMVGQSPEFAGFWNGLWHGFILGITFVVSLFNDSVGVYETHNNGHLYDLGYLFGILIFFGGSGGGARRKTRK